MKRIAITALIAFLVSSALGQSLKPDPWLEDFTQLKHEMATHYANLEWAVSERGLDLQRLSGETEAAVKAAKTDAEARIAIDTFLRTFGDGHLRAEWVSAAPSSVTSIPNGPLCERLGFRARANRTALDFATLNGFRSVDAEESKFISAGFGTLANGKRFGVVGIRLFDESIFPELCDAAAAELKLSQDSTCDDECVNKIRSRTGNLYVAAMAAQVKRLSEAKIDILVVDLVGNGGGNDVYQPMARMLTPVRLRSPASGFVRHPHWAKQNRDRLSDIEAAIPASSGSMREKLTAAVAAARRDLREAARLWPNSPKTRSNTRNRANFRIRCLGISILRLAVTPIRKVYIKESSLCW